LGLLPSGPDPVGEGCARRQPPDPHYPTNEERISTRTPAHHRARLPDACAGGATAFDANATSCAAGAQEVRAKEPPRRRRKATVGGAGAPFRGVCAAKGAKRLRPCWRRGRVVASPPPVCSSPRPRTEHCMATVGAARMVDTIIPTVGATRMLDRLGPKRADAEFLKPKLEAQGARFLVLADLKPVIRSNAERTNAKLAWFSRPEIAELGLPMADALFLGVDRDGNAHCPLAV